MTNIHMITTRRIIFILSILFFIGGVWYCWSYSIDDAYITYRYAEHLADGHGLVFNAAEQPVEGYSNFLWLLLLSLLYKLGLSTYMTAKFLGVVSFALAGLVWFRLREKQDDLTWVAAPLFLICPITAFWAVSGLELGLHALLISMAVVALLRQSRWLAGLLVLIILSRPEGVAIALVMVVAGGIITSRQGALDKKQLLTGLAVIITTTFALVLFRLSVFGYPLPNTYYAKQDLTFLSGLKELILMLKIFSPFLLAFIVSLFLSVKRKITDNLLLVSSLLFIAQALISTTVVPVMNFNFRYVIPFLPLLFIGALFTISRFKKPIVIILLTLGGIATFYHLFSDLGPRINGEKRIWAAQQELIEWINQQPESIKISMIDMGRVPYYTKIRYYDIGGLVDPETAHLGFSRYREHKRKPDFFVLVGHFQEDKILLKFGRERMIASVDIFLEHYELIKVFTPPGVEITDKGYHYLVYQRFQ